jgi:hypothetical protein
MNPDERTQRTRLQAKQQRRGRAIERAAFVEGRRGDVCERELNEAMARKLAELSGEASLAAPSPTTGASRPSRPIVQAMPTGDVRRWVPIGPSVVRNGQAVGRPRVVGRIRDLQVDGTGQRAYAASAKGGVWYTGDGGASWDPVGGYAPRSAQVGGDLNPLVCGCLLVSFGANAGADHVMVGSGELVPWQRPTGHSRWGGMGVFAAVGPAATAVGASPWEAASGLAQMEGRGVFRLARHPTAAAAGAVGDVVVAATDAGPFVGLRVGGLYAWTAEGALDTFTGTPGTRCTDALWLGAAGNGRLFVAVDSQGIAFIDNLDGFNTAAYAWNWVPGLGPGAALGRLSLSVAPSGTLYALGENLAGAPTVWQLTAPLAAPLVNPPVTARNVPATLWQPPAGSNQRDYDQAIVADTSDTVGVVDRVYLGGSTVRPRPTDEWSASLYCFDVTPPVLPAVQPTLTAPATVSATANPPGGSGADQAGLVGNNLHADVHVIRLTGAAPPARQVWVGCDGGLYVSAQSGRINSFQHRANGMAVIEAGFVASHPTSSHFAAIGVQDNGAQIRSGDTVWEAIQVSDGGGVAFHPVRSDVIMSQSTRGSWRGVPTARFIDPFTRTRGGTWGGTVEGNLGAFYSGAAAIVNGAAGRLAVGSNRVWLSDNVGTTGAISWAALPFPGPTVATDTYAPNGAGVFVDGNPGFGVPPGALGAVITVKFATPGVVHALYQNGVVTYTFSVAGPPVSSWTAVTVLPDPGGTGPPVGTVLTDLATVPGSATDFYLTTAGETVAGVAPLVETCWLFTGGAFVATTLRNALDTPGVPVVPGPLDPAYAAVVDSGNPTDVYVGTVTGVWHGMHTPAAGGNADSWVWTPFVNGLPPVGVQDLNLWVNPAGGGTPRLLRAATQSRGVWEVDLTAGFEPSRTYVRVHARDDRRVVPTDLRNPRNAPTAALLDTVSSPDITVRPRANPAAAPRWRYGAGTITSIDPPVYELWTFQTAFRWHYPSVIPMGLWSDQFGDLVRFHRSQNAMLPPGAFIDRALWDAIVTNTHLNAAGNTTASAGDPLAVYRPPWQTPMAMNAVGSEIDLIESIRPVLGQTTPWRAYREPTTVDVLVHHRDTRPLIANDAYAVLLWQSNASRTTLENTDLSALPGWMVRLLGGNLDPTPSGWNLATSGAGAPIHQLSVPLDARMPRAISVDVDLSAVPAGHFVMFVAVVGSSVNPSDAPAVPPINTVPLLVRAWANSAARLIRVFTR